jgi:5-methylcytosine-specific restriction endonuclease McrA
VPLKTTFDAQSINQLLLMHRDRQINLNPGFQRKSVWTLNDRRKLIQSIIAEMPLPNIFLYHQATADGQLQYDVIDGKQRLETIFMFTRAPGFGRTGFEVKLDLGSGLRTYDWSTICRKHPATRAAFERYKLQTVEITGSLGEIIDVFVGINSTGKRLTSGEKRHARFYTSRFLQNADKLVRTHRKWILEQKVLSVGQLDRMKGVELFSELLMSINAGGPINKKTALDRAIGNDAINAHTLKRISSEFTHTLNLIKRKFPHLREMRFHNSVELYTLFLVYWEMRHDGFALQNSNADKLANHLLRELSKGVDNLREHLRRATLPKDSSDKLYSEYLLTVQGDTDSFATRQRRREIVRGLLVSLYEEQDAKRIFTPEQRRLIWHSEEKKTCTHCGKPMTWSDFSVDHILAFARGGRTSLKNAQMMHRGCNSRKGARDTPAAKSKVARRSTKSVR